MKLFMYSCRARTTLRMVRQTVFSPSFCASPTVQVCRLPLAKKHKRNTICGTVSAWIRRVKLFMCGSRSSQNKTFLPRKSCIFHTSNYQERQGDFVRLKTLSLQSARLTICAEMSTGFGRKGEVIVTDTGNKLRHLYVSLLSADWSNFSLRSWIQNITCPGAG